MSKSVRKAMNPDDIIGIFFLLDFRKLPQSATEDMQLF